MPVTANTTIEIKLGIGLLTKTPINSSPVIMQEIIGQASPPGALYDGL